MNQGKLIVNLGNLEVSWDSEYTMTSVLKGIN